MKYKVALKIVIMTIVVMCIQIFIPAFNFYNLVIVPDILIIFLTYIGFYYGRFYVIIWVLLLAFHKILLLRLN